MYIKTFRTSRISPYDSGCAGIHNFRPSCIAGLRLSAAVSRIVLRIFGNRVRSAKSNRKASRLHLRIRFGIFLQPVFSRRVLLGRQIGTNDFVSFPVILDCFREFMIDRFSDFVVAL